jgi:hypothetical protein
VNSNIFTRIFRHLTVHLGLKDLLELKEFKDLGLKVLKLRKLLNLNLLEHSKKIQRRSSIRSKIQDDVQLSFFSRQTFRFYQNPWRYCKFEYIYANIWTLDCSS